MTSMMRSVSSSRSAERQFISTASRVCVKQDQTNPVTFLWHRQDVCIGPFSPVISSSVSSLPPVTMSSWADWGGACVQQLWVGCSSHPFFTSSASCSQSSPQWTLSHSWLRNSSTYTTHNLCDVALWLLWRTLCLFFHMLRFSVKAVSLASY